MKTIALVCTIALISVSVHAQEKMSYTNVSKYMLNNAYVQSPVYTKKMYRAIRETDTYNYQAQLAELDMLKENRQISTREYNEKKTQLEKEYNKIYGRLNPAAQSAMIRQAPVESFYYAAMEPGERLRLIALSSPELTDAERDVPTPQMPVVQTRSQATAPVMPVNRRSLSNIATGTENEEYDNEPFDASAPVSPAAPKKKALGKKSIPVKIGAF